VSAAMLRGLVWLAAVATGAAYSLAPAGHQPPAFRARLPALRAPVRRARHAPQAAGARMLWGFLPPQKAPAEPQPTIVEVNNQAEFESMLFSSDMVDKLLVVDWSGLSVACLSAVRGWWGRRGVLC